jgi:O-antigen/teichoic acid export membrane protein
MNPEVNRESHPPARSLFKSILEGTGVYSILSIAQRMISLGLLPIATRYLTPADYGVIGLLDNTNSVLALLLGVQLSSAFGYFYFEKGSGKTASQVVGTTFGGALLLGLLAGGLGWAMAAPLSHLVFAQRGFESLLRFSFYALPVTFLAEAGFTWLRIEERLKMYVVASLAKIILAFLAVILLLVWMHRGVWGMIIANLGASCVVTALLIGFALASIRLEFDFGLLRRMLRFAAPLGVSGLAMFFIHYGDQFVLPNYVPLSEVGLYNVAYKIGMAVSIIQGSFLTYWNAQVFKIVQRSDARSVFARTFTYMTLILAFSAVGLVLLALPTLRIFSTPKFYDAAAIVPLLVLAYFLRSIAEFLRSLFFATNHPGQDAICTSISLAICVAGYFLLIPRWGIWGAASATVICFAFMMMLIGIWTHRFWAFELEAARLAKILFATAVCVGIHFLVPAQSLWAQIGWTALLLGLFPVLLLVLRFQTPAERQLVATAWARMRAGNLPWSPGIT